MKTKCKKFYFVYIFFQSALKVYMESNVDVHSKRILNFFSKCVATLLAMLMLVILMLFNYVSELFPCAVGTFSHETPDADAQHLIV